MESTMGRMRSPNYPAIPLAQAVDLVEKIFKEDRTNAIEKEDAAKHMGYSGLTGRTLKLLGALSQFALLDKVGKGQVRVSKTAVSILHPKDDEERKEAVLKAGRSPVLFRRIRESFDDPSPRTITSFLMREGFTDRAVDPVLKSYTLTNGFLAANGVSESYGPGDEEAPDSESDHDEEETMNPAPIQPPEPPPVSGDNKLHILNFDLKSVTIGGRTTSPDELEDFIGQLTALQGLFKQFASKEKANAPEGG
jgi:hypothetical protein